MQIHMEQLLRLINQRNRQIIQIKSIDLDKELVSEEELNSFPSQVKMIYEHFFNGNNNAIDIEKVIPFQVKKTKVPVCNKVFKTAQSFYRCYDCFIHEAAVLCEPCFQNGTHAGHRFQRIESSGGNCDCGNALALKKQGFCKNHTGTVEVPIIAENQQFLFNATIENMFRWFFELQNRKQKNGLYFLNDLIKYLVKLNKQSIYYNVLTFHFLTKKTTKNSTYIDDIFKLQQDQVCRSFNELFFNMFSLDQFKIILADRYIYAYNHVANFERSSFHSLYIQLFANDNVVLDVVTKFKNIIYVQKKNYDFEVYLQDVNFISSISEQAATIFYQSFFNKNKYIPFPILDEIQKDLQQAGELHRVDLVSKFIKEQNFFYYTYTEILKKNKDNQKMLITILQGIYYQMNSSPYSYIKNRAILPFHRMFALSLFTLFKGNNDLLSLENVAMYLKVQQNDLLNFYMKAVDEVINCLIDFAETYAGRNYFDNYVVLYVRSGVSCGLFDQLFIKQASVIYSKLNLNFQDKIKTKLIERIKEITQNKKHQTWVQCLQTWIYLCEILLEISVASSTQILLNGKLKLNNKCIKDKKQTLFKSLLNKIGSLTKEQLPVLEKHFVDKLDENFLYENCEYNKLTKKYSLRKELQTLPFCYNIFLSKKKSGQMLFTESQLSEKQMKELNKVYASQKDSILMQTTIPKSIVETLVDYTIKSIQQKDITVKEQETILSSLKNLIFKMQIYEIELGKYSSIEQKIRVYQPKSEENDGEQTEAAEKMRLKLLKKRQSEKKSMFLNKQANIMKLYNEKQEQKFAQISEQTLICLKCKDEKKNNQSLCYFANIKYKKILSAKTKDNKFSFLYTSCFHLIHFSCFREICEDSIKAYCPLCKAGSNIVIPVQSKYSPQTFNQSRKRIEGVMKKLKQPLQKQGQNKSNATELFKSLIECLLEYIGFAGVLNNKQFQKKLLRICKELVSLLSMVYNTYDNESKQVMKKNLLLTLETKNNLIRSGEGSLKGEVEQKKDMKLIYQGIKSCILSVIINIVLENKLLFIKNIVSQYCKYLNWEDLSKIIHNLQSVFPNNLSRDGDVTISQNNISNLFSFYCYYQPPFTMKQVIAERDSKILENCKAGHNVCYCTECKQIFCEDCKTITVHSHEHGSESMYLSLLTGSLLLFIPRQIKTLSLYQNKFGTPWTPDHDPQGFTLNEQLYKNFVLNLSLHTIEEFLQREKSKISIISMVFE